MLGTLKSWIAAKFRQAAGNVEADRPHYQARHARRAEAARRRLRMRADARMVYLCGADYTRRDVYRMHRRGALTTAKAEALGAQFDRSRRAA
jgi:hypothetical protein